MQETWVRSLDRENPLEKSMATHSSIVAWRSPWTEEPGGLQSTGGRKEWVMTERLTLSLFTFTGRSEGIQKSPRKGLLGVSGTFLRMS